MSRRRHRASSAPAAMPLDELEQWLQARAERRPIATCIAMLDGYVTAIVAGPVSISPPNWICPLLAIDADAFNHAEVRGDLRRRAAPQRDQQRSFDRATSLRADAQPQAEWRRRRGSVVPGLPCRHATRLKAWAPLLDLSNINHGLLLPILLHCVDDQGRPLLGPARKGRDTAEFLRNTHSDIPAAGYDQSLARVPECQAYHLAQQQ
jgi:uncharacterized protein